MAEYVKRTYKVDTELFTYTPKSREDLSAWLEDRIPDRSTYEKHLVYSLKEWTRCAAGRFALLESNIKMGTDRATCHVLMENWNQATEVQMAYEKALGIKRNGGE
jgi:hypothetical protein